jgi:hypothetical protein
MAKTIAKTERNAKPSKPSRRRLVGTPRNKLEVENQQPGFVYFWINDNGSELSDHIEAGYEFVLKTDPEKASADGMTGPSESVDTKVSKIVDRHGLKAFLMRIPQEFFAEDEAARSANQHEILEQIESGGISEFDGSYKKKNHKVVTNTNRF